MCVIGRLSFPLTVSRYRDIVIINLHLHIVKELQALTMFVCVFVSTTLAFLRQGFGLDLEISLIILVPRPKCPDFAFDIEFLKTLTTSLKVSTVTTNFSKKIKIEL